jgi:DNA invertase Pin-like site-specific DNA recombinase
VPSADRSPDPSTLDDGRLDELAARHGVTIAEVPRTTTGRRYNLGRPRRPADLDEVVRRYQAGASLKTIGRELGVSPDAVRTALIHAEVPRRPAVLAPRSGPDTDEVRRRYAAGESVYAIARTLGSTEHLVRKAIERAGMERRPRASTKG